MNRLLSNVSVKMSLTLVLAVFSLLIMIIAFLGYQSGKQGEISLAELDDAAMHQMLPLNRAQRSVANAQLNYMNSLAASEEGDARLAQEYQSQAQAFQVEAQDFFQNLSLMIHIRINHSLPSQLLPLLTA